MKAALLHRSRTWFGETRFADVLIWQLPTPLPGSAHTFKYRLAFVVDGTCALRFDNEIGKGDHMHDGAQETRYEFQSLEQLVSDFWAAVGRI